MNSEENYAQVQTYRKLKYFPVSIQIKKSLVVVHLNPNPITLTLEGCTLRGNKITH